MRERSGSRRRRERDDRDALLDRPRLARVGRRSPPRPSPRGTARAHRRGFGEHGRDPDHERDAIVVSCEPAAAAGANVGRCRPSRRRPRRAWRQQRLLRAAAQRAAVRRTADGARSMGSRGCRARAPRRRAAAAARRARGDRPIARTRSRRGDRHALHAGAHRRAPLGPRAQSHVQGPGLGRPKLSRFETITSGVDAERRKRPSRFVGAVGLVPPRRQNKAAAATLLRVRPYTSERALRSGGRRESARGPGWRFEGTSGALRTRNIQALTVGKPPLANHRAC